MTANDETMSRIAARNTLRRRVYPEVAAGGFTGVDGTVEFYTRVNALLRPDMVVVDYGAGRGRFMEDESAPLRRDLCNLQNKVAKVVGLDLDDVVLSNPFSMRRTSSTSLRPCRSRRARWTWCSRTTRSSTWTTRPW